nr:fatty acid desaturase [SAR86 cluster bacterium]
GQAVLAKFNLEVVNYMEHYGLVRNSNHKVGPEHSWNTNKRMSTMVLFSLTRHSAHHEKPRRKYWKLDPYENGPEMPFGYLTTLLVCLIPPLWFSIMAPKLSDWDHKYAFSN